VCRPTPCHPPPRVKPPRGVPGGGVGDTHIATMCAALLLGHDFVEAARMANAAAAITISHESALPVPSWEQIREVMKNGSV